MSKLFGLFGKKKKNKKQISSNLLDMNIDVVSEPQESVQNRNTAPKSIVDNVDYSESDMSEDWPKMRYSRTLKEQGLQSVNLLKKSPSDRIFYTNGNKRQSLNIYRAGIDNEFHKLNRYTVPELKSSNNPSGPQDLENISEDISRIPEVEYNIPEKRKTSVMAQTGAPTRNSVKFKPNGAETSNQNGPEGFVVLRENNIQRCSKNLDEYVNNLPYRGNKPLDKINNDEREQRALPNKQVRLSTNLRNETGPNILSLIRYEDQPGKTIRQGRVSVLVPLSLDGQDSGPKRATGILDPIAGFVSEVQPRKLSVVKPGAQIEGLDKVRFSVLNPEDMKPMRQSVMKPVMEIDPNKQTRLSTLNPIRINDNTRSGRLSMSRPLGGIERFPLNSTQQPVIYAVRKGTDQPENKKSLFLKRLFSGKRGGEKQEEEEGAGGVQQDQTVYTISEIPTRGRTGSILQQSVKYLTSQKEETPVSRKNIRYSVDTDVFSADVKQRNVNPLTPGYVNMERGQGMLVSDLLNPITSIFVSDLKDPVPKDPRTRPREANIWVKPRQNSVREVVTPMPTYKRTRRVQLEVVPVATPTKIQSKSKQVHHSRYESEDESSSSYSEESIESVPTRSKYLTNRKPTHHRVYAATMPSVNLPDLIREVDDTSSTKGNINLAVGTTLASTSPSTNVRSSEIRQSRLVQPPNVRRMSTVQQTDIEDAVNFLCNPPGDI